MQRDVDKLDSSTLFVAFVVGSAFEFIAQLPEVYIWLRNDVQCKCISDRVDAKSQCPLLPIRRGDLRHLGIPVIIFHELDSVVHVQIAW